MPAGDSAPRVPEYLAVIMGVEINKARCDDLAMCVDDLLGAIFADIARNLDDPAILHANVGAKTRRLQAIDHSSPFDNEIICPRCRHFPDP